MPRSRFKLMPDDEKVILTPEQAKALLPPGDQIHTFMQAGPVLLGANWDRSSVEAEIDKCTCELAGPAAMAMNHGLALHTSRGPVFVETQRHNTDMSGPPRGWQ